MLLAREGRSLVSRCECMPDNITSNCEYVEVNLSEDRSTHCLWRVLASCLYHSVPAMFSAWYRFTHGIRMCASARESSPGCDQIFLTNRTLPEPAFQDLACAASCRCGVSSAKDDQREPTAETRHPGVDCKLAALQSAYECIAITGCSSYVHFSQQGVSPQ